MKKNTFLLLFLVGIYSQESFAKDITYQINNRDYITHDESQSYDYTCLNEQFDKITNSIKNKKNEVNINEFLLESNNSKVLSFNNNKKIMYFYNNIKYIFNPTYPNEILISHGTIKSNSITKWNIWNHNKLNIKFNSCLVKENTEKEIKKETININNIQPKEKNDKKSSLITDIEKPKEILQPPQKEESNPKTSESIKLNTDSKIKIEDEKQKQHDYIVSTIVIPEHLKNKIKSQEEKKNKKNKTIQNRNKNDEKIIAENINEIKAKTVSSNISHKNRLCLLDNTQKIVAKKYPNYNPQLLENDVEFKKYMDKALIMAFEVCFNNKPLAE